MNLLLSIIVSILTFGAVADGSTNNAGAINRAISECHKRGGGTVVVPAGTFASGSIFLQSNVTLRLEKGATLKGVEDLKAYQPLHTSANLDRYDSGRGTVNSNLATDSIWTLAFIHIEDADNVAICGGGTIDGCHLFNPQGEEHQRGPHAILIANSSRLHLQGFTVRRAANYGLLAYQISSARFDRLHFEQGWDGIHIRGARNVSIRNCKFQTGDDAIAGGYWNRMVISGCDINSSCNGIRMIQPSQHLTVKDCRFYGPGDFPHRTSGKTSSDAAISLEPGGWGPAPGRLDDIVLKNIDVKSMLTPLSVTLSEDNTLGRICVDHLVAHDITRMALSVKSWGTARSKQVKIRHAVLEFRGIDDPSLPDWFKTHTTDQWPVFPSWAMYFRNVDHVSVKNVICSFTGKDYRKPILYDHVGKIDISRTHCRKSRSVDCKGNIRCQSLSRVFRRPTP